MATSPLPLISPNFAGQTTDGSYAAGGGQAGAAMGQPSQVITTPTGGALPGADVANQGKPGYDVFGNPVASSPAPINRTVLSGANGPGGATGDPATDFLNTFQAPKSADQIAEEKRKSSQGLIDSINANFDSQLQDEKKAGAERLAQDNAVSVLSGLTGSTDAVRTHNTVTDANGKAEAAINNQRAQSLAQVYSKISSDAAAEAEQQKQDARLSAQDIIDRRTKLQTQALDNLKTMATGGLVDFESFKSSPQNAQVYQYALDAVGGSEDALKAVFAINRPQDQIIGTPTRVGDHFVQAYKNPLTGKVSYDTIQMPFDVGPEYKTFQKMGDNLVAIPDNWDGDVTKLKTIAGQPSQQDILDMQYKKAQIANMNDPLDRQYKQAQIQHENTLTQGATLDNLKKKNDLTTVKNPTTPDGTTAYDSLTIRRYNLAANAALKPYLALPGYSLTANGQAYLSRIESASAVPGSVSDQDLLDAVTKLNNAGGQVTEAQVNVVLKGASLADKANVWKNYISKNGGVLSDDQREQLVDVSNAIYAGYKKMYQPIYNTATSKLKQQGVPEAFWNIPDLNKLSAAVSDSAAGTQSPGEAPAAGGSDADPLGLGI